MTKFSPFFGYEILNWKIKKKKISKILWRHKFKIIAIFIPYYVHGFGDKYKYLLIFILIQIAIRVF